MNLKPLRRAFMAFLHGDSDLRDVDQIRRAELDEQYEEDALEVARQLRRRRETASRLPPLPTGFRDPIDSRRSDAPRGRER